MVLIVNIKLSREILALLFGKTKQRVVVFVSLFVWVRASNSMSLLPYIFTPSRHLVVRLRLALPL